LAQNPYLVPPDLTIENSAASPLIHKILLLALGLGSLILFPSIYYLYHIFKGHEPQALTVASEHVSVKK
jgi:cytochrome d ubiquinol oxidase subunit II